MSAPTPPPEDLLRHDRYVRSIARSLLFEEHAVDDVVQDTWLSALRGGPRKAGSLRLWLGSIARNLSIDRRRRERARAPHESAAAKPEAVPSPAEMLAWEQTRRRIVDEVLALPEPYRGALWLRFFEELPPRAIAARFGVPTETARTWVKRGLEQVREKLDRQYAGRREWCLALLPLAAAAPSLGWGAAAAAASKTTFQSIAMATTQTKVGIAAAVLAALAAAIWSLERRAERPAGSATSIASKAAATATAPAAAPGAMTTAGAGAPAEGSRAAVAESKPNDPPANAKDPFGALALRLRWAADKSPAAGIGVKLHPEGLENRFFAYPSARTDAEGTARFERLPPGNCWVRIDRWQGRMVRLKSGEVLELELAIPEGSTIDASVVDAGGRAVAGAEVILNEQGLSPWTVATTDADGKAKIRDVGERTAYYVGARAPGYAPSVQVQMVGRKGTVHPVKLVLPGPGGAVEGRVVDPAGKPVANVEIQIGAILGDYFPLPGGGYGAKPLAPRARSDEAGRFRLDGLQVGRSPATARIAGFAPWKGEVEVTAAAPAPLEIALSEGVTLLGTVADSSGKPASGVRINTGDWGTIDEFEITSREDGSYALRDLPAGSVDVNFEKANVGKASFRLRGNPGDTLRHDPILTLGLSIRGRVVDSDGKPVKDAGIQAWPIDGNPGQGLDSGGFGATDADGRFEFHNCRDVSHYVSAGLGTFTTPTRIENVRPGRGELTIVLALEKSDCYIQGTVVDSQGKPLSAATVGAQRPGVHSSPFEFPDPKTGAFRLGPLPPGAYSLRIGASGFGERRFRARKLESGDTWDVGTVELWPPTKLTVHWRLAPGTDPAARPAFELVDEAGPHVGGGFDVEESGTARLRGGVSPGAYAIQVQGLSIAAAQVPVTLTPGPENVVEVVVRGGIAQAFRFEKPNEMKILGQPPRFTVRDAAGNAVQTLLLWGWGDGPLELGLFYAAGEYRYEVVADAEPRASGSFRVGSAPGDPVRVTLK